MKHSGKDIVNLFFNFVFLYKIEHEIQGITRNNESANFTFKQNLNKLIPGLHYKNKHFLCSIHIINLGVQSFLKILNGKYIITDKDLYFESSDVDLNDDARLH